MAKGYSVHIEARFEAAHNLRSYRGTTEPLHGHSYRVVAELSNDQDALDQDAIAVDFVSSTRELQRLAKRLDYTYINEVDPFTTINPSAENIASWFHRELTAALASEKAVVHSVTVWEGPQNFVTFRPEEAK